MTTKGHSQVFLDHNSLIRIILQILNCQNLAFQPTQKSLNFLPLDFFLIRNFFLLLKILQVLRKESLQCNYECSKGLPTGRVYQVEMLLDNALKRNLSKPVELYLRIFMMPLMIYLWHSFEKWAILLPFLLLDVLFLQFGEIQLLDLEEVYGLRKSEELY